MSLFIGGGSAYALTAEQVAAKSAAVISGNSGLEASFTLSSGGHSTKGVIKSAGSKFCVIIPEVSTWYNGKALYVYNPRTSETTVSTPDASELLESNPLLYVKGNRNAYTYSFSPAKVKGKYVVELTPRNKRSGLRKLTFTINATSFKPEKIVVNTSGGTSTVVVTSLKTGISLPAGTFEYPKAKYPKAEIVDLR